MVDQRIERVDPCPDRAQFRIAEERRRVGLDRQLAAIEHDRRRRDATVGDAVVAEVLVAERDLRPVAGAKRERRVDTVALQLEAVAIVFGIFVQRSHAKRRAFIERLADVDRATAAVVVANLHRHLVVVIPVGDLGDAVDHAAGTAAAKDHGVRAFQRLDALDVVEVADVLHVVAHAVDEQVRGRAVAAQDGCVAIALALRNADAGDIADRRRSGCSALVADLLLRHHGDRLRDVAQQRVGLGRGGAALGGVTIDALGVYLDDIEMVACIGSGAGAASTGRLNATARAPASGETTNFWLDMESPEQSRRCGSLAASSTMVVRVIRICNENECDHAARAMRKRRISRDVLVSGLGQSRSSRVQTLPSSTLTGNLTTGV